MLLVIPVGDILSGSDPNVIMADNVVQSLVNPLGSEGLAGDERMQAETEETSCSSTLRIEYVELVAHHLVEAFGVETSAEEGIDIVDLHAIGYTNQPACADLDGIRLVIVAPVRDVFD